ncbi:Methylesterase 1 [Abeliophyllum distichum]|uniref:Methylesterase 1 n=1 Tax=Abeliophyllum distichum TaxID=126358 RepID=A0ABD1V3J6_9LAMI
MGLHLLLVAILFIFASTSVSTTGNATEMEGKKQKKHFVLVHGSCHGSWCWYKLKPLLEAAGHRVTAMDLSASGINPKSLDELQTFSDYTLPLLEVMESISPDEKVVLVGHSLGGMNMALAMEKYPNKISVAVFVTAFMPDTIHAPSFVLDKALEQTPEKEWLDTQFLPFGKNGHLTSVLFGPQMISSKLYQLCSPEDVALAKSLLRPSSFFKEDLSKKRAFSNEGFGSVKRAYIVCAEDKAMKEEFQRWQIKNSGVAIVKEIKNADHMVMLSKPQKLCQRLLDIVN